MDQKFLIFLLGQRFLLMVLGFRKNPFNSRRSIYRGRDIGCRPNPKLKSEDSRGGADFWIAKVDENGTKIWDKTLGSSQRDVLENIISLGDNSYLLSGYSASNSSGEKSEDSKGGSDFWVIKIKDLDE